jgi:hypothetical protein
LWVALVIVAVAADLLYADYGLNPGAPPDLYRRPAASAAGLRAALQGRRLFYFPNDDYDLKYGRFVSFKSFGPSALAYGARESMLADTIALDGIASANNFDPLVSARYAGLMNVISATRSLPLLRLMDVGVIASPASLDLDLISTSAEAGVHFYRVPGEPRRVWVVTATVMAPNGAAALAAMADPAFDPGVAVVLEADDAAGVSTPGSLTPSPAALTIPVNLAQAGWVVLADTYYPGWVATVDGHAAPVRHADYAFRAVAVPPGAHTVVFDYRPASLRAGLALSALSLLIVVAMSAWNLAWPRRGRIG